MPFAKTKSMPTIKGRFIVRSLVFSHEVLTYKKGQTNQQCAG